MDDILDNSGRADRHCNFDEPSRYPALPSDPIDVAFCRVMAFAYQLEQESALGEQIRVRGLVQGVGFRPTVWRLARDCGLTGEVLNDSEGVLIRAWGARSALARFIQRLCDEAPPLARIDAVESSPLRCGASFDDFWIIPSCPGQVQTGVVPDAATCPACAQETLKPGSRRYRYPFTNCTHCGPRLSIVRAIPYDRSNTSMADFGLCEGCRTEYEDPADRRFHAQPNACPACGPRVWLERTDRSPIPGEAVLDPVGAARRLLLEGEIVAIKGIGGFHLACDATNGQAVARLRGRKRRYHKGFALIGTGPRRYRALLYLAKRGACALGKPGGAYRTV